MATSFPITEDVPTAVDPTMLGELLPVVRQFRAAINDLAALMGSGTSGYAPLASPTFTGTPTVPTASASTNSTQAASTAFVQALVALLAPQASPTFTGTVSGITKSMVGLSSVDNTSDVNKPISSAAATALAAKADLVGGLVPTSQIPALALNTVAPVASRSAMLALTSATVQPGDVAVDTSTGATRGSYMLLGTDPSQIGNWVLLAAPTDAVATVNGQAGTVVLAAADVGADPVGAAAAATTAAQATSAQRTANLSDLASSATARTNLGLGTAATQPSTAFDPAGAAAAITLTGLGAGTAATHSATDFDAAGAATAATAAAQAALTAQINDLFGLGFATTMLPGNNLTGQTWSGINDVKYVRLLTGGTISKIAVHITAQSGNIGVFAFQGTGAGQNRIPGTLLGASGSVACPAVGYQTIALTASITVAPGDFLALWADNTTVAFLETTGQSSNLFKGLSYGSASGSGSMTTASGIFSTSSRLPALVGLA